MNTLKNYHNELIDQEFVQINKFEIKKITHILIRSYKRGEISKRSFNNNIKILLTIYLENKFNEKLLPKTLHFEKKIYSLLEGYLNE